MTNPPVGLCVFPHQTHESVPGVCAGLVPADNGQVRRGQRQIRPAVRPQLARETLAGVSMFGCTSIPMEDQIQRGIQMCKPGTCVNTLLSELAEVNRFYVRFQSESFLFGGLAFTEYLAELSVAPYPTRFSHKFRCPEAVCCSLLKSRKKHIDPYFLSRLFLQVREAHNVCARCDALPLCRFAFCPSSPGTNEVPFEQCCWRPERATYPSTLPDHLVGGVRFDAVLPMPFMPVDRCKLNKARRCF